MITPVRNLKFNHAATRMRQVVHYMYVYMLHVHVCAFNIESATQGKKLYKTTGSVKGKQNTTPVGYILVRQEPISESKDKLLLHKFQTRTC